MSTSKTKQEFVNTTQEYSKMHTLGFYVSQTCYFWDTCFVYRIVSRMCMFHQEASVGTIKTKSFCQKNKVSQNYLNFIDSHIVKNF